MARLESHDTGFLLDNMDGQYVSVAQGTLEALVKENVISPAISEYIETDPEFQPRFEYKWLSWLEMRSILKGEHSTYKVVDLVLWVPKSR